MQEISNEDILAEGINDLGSYGANYDYFEMKYGITLTPKGHPQENNDWVWVYEFMHERASIFTCVVKMGKYRESRELHGKRY